MTPRNAEVGDDGVRRYTWQGVTYPSVTSVRKLVGMPYPLHAWIVNQHLDAAQRLLGAPELDGLDEAQIATVLRKAAMAKRDTAAELGTRVHHLVAEALPPATTEEAALVRQYEHWLDTTNPEVLLTERQVFNLKYGYAGSFDLMYRERTGRERLMLTDLKTGSGVYPDHILQLLGYMDGEFIGADDTVDGAATTLLLEVQGLAILHVRPEGWEVIEVEPDAAAMRAFRGMCVLAHWFDQPDLMSIYTTTTATGAAPVEETVSASQS